MSKTVINLRQARKSKARDRKRAEADANAARHGMTTAERTTLLSEKTRTRRLLDGHQVEDSDRDTE